MALSVMEHLASPPFIELFLERCGYGPRTLARSRSASERHLVDQSVQPAGGFLDEENAICNHEFGTYEPTRAP